MTYNIGFLEAYCYEFTDTNGAGIHAEACFEDQLIMSEEEVQLLLSKCSEGKVMITSKKFPNENRRRLYYYWLQRHFEMLTSEHSKLQADYAYVIKKQNDLRKQQQVQALKQAKVIGMTTTAAARLQDVLQKVGPRIVIVEEAAEVLEAHIITALNSNCQHLILIGDHKQLKPNPTVYQLAKFANLDLSLFERMVNNKLPVNTLDIQHRMRPEISKFVKHIYDDSCDLVDAPSVHDRAAIRGVGKPVLFVNHNHPEAEVEGLMSKRNDYEAEMILEFVRYLLKQGYGESQITIICMYKGQQLLLRDMWKKDVSLNIQPQTVCIDDFQGEENDIIIVSLVRSNQRGELGFVKTQNRICVTLSRAKFGMYVLGNFEMLSKGSVDWLTVVEKAKAAGEFSDYFDLSCSRHKNTIHVKDTKDMKLQALRGGCRELCGEELGCGHTCKDICHNTPHNTCEQRCLKKCERGHQCKRKCYTPCKCEAMTEMRLSCGHNFIQPCWMWDKCDIPECQERCTRLLEDCSHQCDQLCFQPCQTHCTAEVERVCSKCEEIQTVSCSERFICSTPCNVPLSCGHKCAGTCYTCHEGCSIYCTERCETILKCGHRCSNECSDCKQDPDHRITKCEEVCSNFLDCGKHTCVNKCIDCFDKTRGSPACSHGGKCFVLCELTLSCGHRCIGLCGTCGQGGHQTCTEECMKHLSCGHKCRGMCCQCEKKSCLKCMVRCGKLMKCGHHCQGRCGDCVERGSCDLTQCQDSCELRCTQHDEMCIANYCKDECRFTHGEEVKPQYCTNGCRHEGETLCSNYCDEACTIQPCTQPCEKKFKCLPGCRKLVQCIGLCGDICPEMCGKCNFSEMSKEIERELKKKVVRNERWIKLRDCNHLIPVAIMDRQVTSLVGTNKVLCCPFPKCKKPVLNTLRYLTITRAEKFEINRKLRRQRHKSERKQRAQKRKLIKDMVSDPFIRKIDDGVDCDAPCSKITRIDKIIGSSNDPSSQMHNPESPASALEQTLSTPPCIPLDDATDDECDGDELHEQSMLQGSLAKCSDGESDDDQRESMSGDDKRELLAMDEPNEHAVLADENIQIDSQADLSAIGDMPASLEMNITYQLSLIRAEGEVAELSDYGTVEEYD